jgi:hypothetical protein
MTLIKICNDFLNNLYFTNVLQAQQTQLSVVMEGRSNADN